MKAAAVRVVLTALSATTRTPDGLRASKCVGFGGKCSGCSPISSNWQTAPEGIPS